MGKLIVGVSTLLFVVILVSGIVVWWPRNRKALVNRLKISGKKGAQRFWYDLHTAGGMYALLFLLVMALTGLTWSFSWYRNGVYALFGVTSTQNSGTASTSGGKDGKEEKKDTAAGGQHQGRKSRTTAYTHWQRIYEELSVSNEGFEQITLGHGSASVSFGPLGAISGPPTAIPSTRGTAKSPRSTATRPVRHRANCAAGSTPCM